MREYPSERFLIVHFKRDRLKGKVNERRTQAVFRQVLNSVRSP